MGNKISCGCNRGEIKQEEVYFNTNERGEYQSPDSAINYTFGEEHVKSVNKIQNQYRKMKGYEKLMKEVRDKLLYHTKAANEDNHKNREEITVEEFDKMIPNNVRNLISNQINNINQMRAISKGKILIKLLPMKETQIENKENIDYYFGEWSVNGEKCGLGNLISYDGCVYYGYFNKNNFDGYGIYINTNLDYYIGHWSEGKTDGRGKMITSLTVYDGDWQNNKKNGNGEEKYEDGSYYKGVFKNSERHGEGTYIWPDNAIYTGTLHQSEFNGYGEIQWPDGREYKGYFKEGKMHGKGTFKWPNGSQFDGYYKNDSKSGEGTFYWNSDKTKFFAGQWLNNKQHGNGTVNLDGKFYTGLWRYGKLITINEVSSNTNANEEPVTESLNQSQYFTPYNTLQGGAVITLNTLSFKNVDTQTK